MNRTEWRAAEKEIDPEFTGSIFEQLGFEKFLCPTCHAHLQDGICLNACHMGDDGKWIFEAFMGKVAKDKGE